MTEKFAEWAVLELMGHRRLAGRVTEQEIAGHGFLRIDIPGVDGDVATQFYSPSAVYALTPTTEAVARSFALNHRPEPVQRWELPALPKPAIDEEPHFLDRDDDEPEPVEVPLCMCRVGDDEPHPDCPYHGTVPF